MQFVELLQWRSRGLDGSERPENQAEGAGGCVVEHIGNMVWKTPVGFNLMVPAQLFYACGNKWLIRGNKLEPLGPRAGGRDSLNC